VTRNLPKGGDNLSPPFGLKRLVVNSPDYVKLEARLYLAF